MRKVEMNEVIDITPDPATEKRREGAASGLDTIGGAIGDHDGGIAALFAFLEENKEELGFECYSLSPTTLDQVPLWIVGAEEEEEIKGSITKRDNKRKTLFRFWSKRRWY
jgi:hypothetical protein